MNNPEIIVKNAPFKRFCMSIGAIPTSYKDSLDYYETVLYLIKYLEETVIPVVNNNGEAVSELQRLYIELKNYVDNYFTNLDVQEEINNKLDEMATNGELITLIEQATNMPTYFDTVSDMKSFTYHVIGKTYITRGYNNINDGGSASYIVIEDNSTSENGEYIRLNASLCAKMIITDNQVNIKQFGSVGNGSNDDTISIQNALNSSADIIYVPEGNFLITDTLVMPLNKTFKGCNANTCILKVSNFNKYALTYGSSYNYGSKRGKLEDIRIETNDLELNNQTYGIHLYSGLELRNVYLYHLKQAISKESNYIDNIVLYRCHIMYCGGRENSYSVDLPSNGDSLLISQCQFASGYNAENYNEYLGIRIQSSTGVLVVNNIINVPITINSSTATLLNNHMEGASTEEHFNLSNILISNSNVLIDTLYIEKCLNKPEIAIQLETANEAHNSKVTLKNINIVLSSLMFPYYQNTSDCYDLYVGNQVIVEIDNVFNNLDYSAGWSPVRPSVGIIVKNVNGLLEDFNKISSLASIKSVIAMNRVYIDDMLPVVVNGTNNSLSNSNTNRYTPWFESGYNNSSVFYRKVNCYDFERKLCASISSEKEITGVSSYVNETTIGQGTYLNSTLSFMNQTVGTGMLDVIYRGDSTGVYNKITKVPFCCGRALFDFGTHINGNHTENRTSGAIDDFNTVSNFKRIGNNVEFTASSTPLYGTFTKGDRCINSSISSGNIKSWIYDGEDWVSEGEY